MQPASPLGPTNVAGKLSSGRWGSSTRRSRTKKATPPSPMRKAKPVEPSMVTVLPISVLIIEGVLSLYMSGYDGEHPADNLIDQTLLSTFSSEKKKYDVTK